MKTNQGNQKTTDISNNDIRNASLNEARIEAAKTVEDVYENARMSVGYGYENAVVSAVGSALISALK